MSPLELANEYFALSNDSNFDEIAQLFTDSTTFYSAKHEMFLGVTDIMAMQRAHHGSYKSLHWHVTQVEELKPGVVLFDFDFEGVNQAGEAIAFSGKEYVVIQEGKIIHINVRILPA